VVSVSGALPAQPDQVFEMVADWPGHARWQPSLSEAWVDGPLAVGSHLQEVRAAFSQKVRATFEVTDLEPGRLVAARSISGPMKATEAYLVEPEAAGSRLTLTFDLEPPLVLKMFQAYFEPQLRLELERSLENLQLLVAGREPAHAQWVWHPT